MELNNKYEKFEDMEFIDNELMRGVLEYGFITPSKIQNITIKKIYEKGDIIAQSQSGTGKTGAFCIGALTRVTKENKFPQIIIIANTRELATQIHTIISDISKYMKIQNELCIGGQTNDNKKITSQIIIGTPGKINYLMKNKMFLIKEIKLLIMDEGDVLLKDDFIEQINSIFIQLQNNTQICIYSATYSNQIINLATEIMKNPYKILIENENLSLDLIKQYKIELYQEKYKYETLQDIYKEIIIGQCIIFVNSKERVEKLTKNLINDNYTVGKIHSDIDIKQRTDTLKDFRIGKIRILISTDILSRGIDVQQIGIVINYDLPNNDTTYIHRIGRSGRYGKIGITINFVTDRDKEIINNIEKKYNTKIRDMPIMNEINQYLSGVNGYLNLDVNT